MITAKLIEVNPSAVCVAYQCTQRGVVKRDVITDKPVAYTILDLQRQGCVVRIGRKVYAPKKEGSNA